MKNFLQKNLPNRQASKFLNYFLWIFIFIFSLGNLQRIQLPNDIAFYLHDILILIWLIYFVFKNKIKFKINKNILIFLFWILIGWGIAVISGENLLKPILYLSRICFYVLFALSLKNLKLNLNYKFLIFGLLILLFGFLQYFFLPDTRFLKILGWDDHYYRLISSLLDPNFTGIILVITFLLNQKILKNIYLKKILSLLLIIGILLTYSRASYLAFILSLLTLILLGIRTKKIPACNACSVATAGRLITNFIFLALFLFSIPLLPKHSGEGTKLLRTASINSRASSITAELKNINYKNIIFGQGLFVNKTKQDNNNLDIPNHANLSTNSFVQIFTGTGLIGLIIFIKLILEFLKYLYTKKNFYLLAASIATLIHSLFNATLTYPFVVIMLAHLDTMSSTSLGKRRSSSSTKSAVLR